MSLSSHNFSHLPCNYLLYNIKNHGNMVASNIITFVQNYVRIGTLVQMLKAGTPSMVTP